MSLQILNHDDLEQLETRYANQLPEGELMRRAGQAVASYIAKVAEPHSRVVIICGPGNNGGDGFAAALALKQADFAVTCALVGCSEPKTDCARRMYRAWTDAQGLTVSDPYDAPKADVVVDALFGMGLKKPLAGDYQDAAMWFNERQALHISLDVPSGIDAMTGNWVGGHKGCKADVTLCLLSVKAGCFMNDGADAAGKVLVRELDVSVPLTTTGLIDTDDFKHVLEPRAHNSHKGSYGSVCVVGGETGFIGAALLAARAALKLGAGSVSVQLMSAKAPAVDLLYPELMMVTGSADLSRSTCNVVGCGMGFSDAALKRLWEAILSPVALVLDADALRLIAQSPALQDAVLARKEHTVITPHPAEAAALLRCPVEKVLNDRLAAARELSVQTGAITVLKGAGTVVAVRSSRAWVNPTGSGVLATAGSGDVLAGMIGAMFSQGFDLVSATLSAVWLHGIAVQERQAGVRAGDIIDAATLRLDSMRQEHRRS